MSTKFVRMAAGLSLFLFQAAVHAAKLPGHETVKVADGVYAFISAESNNAIVSGNSVAVVGDDGVLVVDSGNFPSETRKLIAEIRQLANLPVRYLVHTHWHRDHTDGDSEYRAAFPNVLIHQHAVHAKNDYRLRHEKSRRRDQEGPGIRGLSAEAGARREGRIRESSQRGGENVQQ
jgi:glyoxylase-like metal-dependent hydrolase (beta-lactamase superfamily II)